MLRNLKPGQLCSVTSSFVGRKALALGSLLLDVFIDVLDTLSLEHTQLLVVMLEIVC